jgi:hypothetical protein
MLPDLWLANSRVRSLWKDKFPEQPKIALVNLAEALFGTADLTRNQVSILINTLAEATVWPTGVADDGIDVTMPDEMYGEEYVAAANHPSANVETWVLEVLSMLLAIPNDVSVLDLYCGDGTLLDVLPETSFYEGHDPNPVHVARARRAHPEAMIRHTDLTQLVNQEVDTTYGLVFCHTTVQRSETAPTCLELRPHLEAAAARQRSLLEDVPTQREHSEPGYRMGWAMAEAAVKACVPGGIVAIASLSQRDFVLDYLRSKGTVLAQIGSQEAMLTLTIFRKMRVKNHVEEDIFLPTLDEVREWAATRGVLARVPVCPDDPRPMVIRPWDIQLTPNPAGKKFGNCALGRDAELYLAKGRVGVRWADRLVAFEWAQHQALTAPPEESWDKTVARFNERLTPESYLRLRQGNLNVMLNLPPAYTVREDPALGTHMGKLGRRLERAQLSYPEKTTLDNRYYTLGVGSVLMQGEDRYEVRFSEPDFSNSKPPKVHIEKV